MSAPHPGTAVTRLADELRSRILSGGAAPGTALREERLADEFAVSRHTVRTALALLTATGLVETVPHRGVRVATFDARRAEALQDLRRAIESEAVDILHRRWGRTWPDAVRAPVEAAIERLGAAERGEGGAVDEAALLRAHSAVHAAIVAAAGSPRLLEVHQRLLDEMDLLLLHARSRYAHGELRRQHAALLAEAQQEGAPAIRRHLEDTLERVARGSPPG